MCCSVQPTILANTLQTQYNRLSGSCKWQLALQASPRPGVALKPLSVGPTCLAPLEGDPVWGSTHNSIVSYTAGEATIYYTTLFQQQQQQQVASRQH